jgi:hypothetical protein
MELDVPVATYHKERNRSTPTDEESESRLRAMAASRANEFWQRLTQLAVGSDYP